MNFIQSDSVSGLLCAYVNGKAKYGLFFLALPIQLYRPFSVISVTASIIYEAKLNYRSKSQS